MNQLIDLLDAALQSNLSKRQWAVFAAVLRQTLGYRKTEDDLSARRLEQLTGIRRNHIWRAKNELVALGLVVSRPGNYGEVLRLSALKPLTPTVPCGVEQANETSVTSSPPDDEKDSPSVPENAPESGHSPAQNGPESSPKQATTLSNLTQCNHDSTVVADESSLRYPTTLSPIERQQAPQKLDGLSPSAAQQVLDVWTQKIERGEVKKSRLGLLVALVNAQRNGSLNTDALPQSPPGTATEDPQHEQRLREREQWLEQQAQQGWLRDMASLGALPPDKLRGDFQSVGGAL